MNCQRGCRRLSNLITHPSGLGAGTGRHHDHPVLDPPQTSPDTSAPRRAGLPQRGERRRAVAAMRTLGTSSRTTAHIRALERTAQVPPAVPITLRAGSFGYTRGRVCIRTTPSWVPC